ncbi:nuclear transport factor 2 family protein [Gordonia polyisoprenivorans]|uniref:nuclear transport factor 2 family protein n=1 Tax=Gordonia polyisoprenivorans TaxID=84595 RepID=UPI003CC83823
MASFIETVNRHDDEGFLDAFTQSGAVNDWGREFTGRDAIKGWSDKEFIGSNGTLTPDTVSVEGDSITVIGGWRSNHANGRSRFRFVTVGNKIERMEISEG